MFFRGEKDVLRRCIKGPSVTWIGVVRTRSGLLPGEGGTEGEVGKGIRHPISKER